MPKEALRRPGRAGSPQPDSLIPPACHPALTIIEALLQGPGVPIQRLEAHAAALTLENRLPPVHTSSRIDRPETVAQSQPLPAAAA